MKEELVSIIVPVYNCEKFISKTIESVLQQTYSNWELILVDDCSEDKSAEIIKEYINKDRRIKYIKLDKNSGAAIARNKGLKIAIGRYIAYLDSDDLWLNQKLERQLKFLKEEKVFFSCCAYEKITEDGKKLNKIIYMPNKMNYEELLSNTIIQTVGVIIDLKYIDKKLLYMPNVRRGQDTATWLQILKSGIIFYGQNEVLAQYRRVSGSLSSNKIKALKRTWYLYRNIEHLSLVKSLKCLVGWAYHASIKRIYFKK